MKAYFPISKPMVGSVIPGIPIRVTTRLVSYPDHSNEKKIGRRRKTVDPVQSFPDMNQQHGAGHPILEKLKQLMSAGGPQHPHAKMGELPGRPQIREGYQAVRENLDWRRM